LFKAAIVTGKLPATITDGAKLEKEKLETSLSMMVTTKVDSPKPGALAVTVTPWSPSWSVSGGTVTSNWADDWPAGTVTVNGTCSLDVKLHVRVTCRSVVRIPPSCTVPTLVNVPAPAVTGEGKLSDEFVISASITRIAV
jgi:hypothetical protein